MYSVSEHREMSRVFPIHPAPGPVSWTRQGAGHFVQSHCVLLSQAVRKRWRGMAAKNSRRRRPGKGERGFKNLCVGENGIESSWDRNNLNSGDEDGMWTAKK